MISFSQDQIGHGWQQLKFNEDIHTLDQYYSFVQQRWILGSFFTSDGEKNKGKVPYRRPISFRNKVGVLPALVKKLWRGRVKKVFN